MIQLRQTDRKKLSTQRLFHCRYHLILLPAILTDIFRGFPSSLQNIGDKYTKKSASFVFPHRCDYLRISFNVLGLKIDVK
jgi:hypothetical protein